MSDLERAVAFLAGTYRKRAEQVVPFPWGDLVATPSLPKVWDANFALVTRWSGSAAELAREMETVQAEAGFGHRKTVLLDEELAAPLWPEIAEQGWEFASRYVVMVQRRPPDRAPDPAAAVVDVGDEAWAGGRREMSAIEGHGADPELADQLLELDARVARALDVRRLAALVDGAVASYAGLYLGDGVAQIEDVATLPSYRGRGLARSVVLHAAAEGRRAGAEVVFLVADEDDWPRELYARLGFDAVGWERVFGRSSRQHSPL